MAVGNLMNSTAVRARMGLVCAAGLVGASGLALGMGPVAADPGVGVVMPDTSESGSWIADGILVQSHMPISVFPGGNSLCNDLWGYVSPSGREYALVGFSDGFAFVEITDPTSPQLIFWHNGPNSTWRDIKVVGTHAYGVTEAGGGINVYDMSNIDNGTVTFRGTTGSGASHNIVANPDTGYIYRVGGNGPGLRAYNTNANANNPPFVGSWNDFYIHDAQVVVWQNGPLAGRELAFCNSGTGNGTGDTRLRIVDVTNKSNMVLIGDVAYSNRAIAHQGWLTEDQRYYYLNDELDESNFGFTTRTRIIDVQDPTNPIEVGFFTSGLDAIDHNLYTHNGMVFESNYRSGLRVFDYATDPLNPVEIASLDTFPADDAASFDGNWSNYPYFPSGTIILSDMQQGLIIARLQIDRIDLDFVDGAPSSFSPGGGDSVRVIATQVNLTLDPSSMTLHIDDGQQIINVPGSLTGFPGEFEFITPVLACDDTPSFWVSAEATTGESFFLPQQAPTARFDAFVAEGGVASFADNFQTNMGWGVTNSGGLSDGAWTRGVPVNGQRADPPTDFDGSGAAYVTDNVTGNSDVDGGSTTLTSPAMDATGQLAVLSYARWYSNSFGASPMADVMTIEVSNNNGASWTNLETIGPGGAEVSGGWFLKNFMLNDVFANPSSQVRVRFTASDLGDGSVVEAGVDAVTLTIYECVDVTPCPADLTGSADPNDPGFGVPDGIVDASDFFFYLGLFGAGDLAADLTGSINPNDPGFGVPDGTLDANDFFFYLDLFAQGCG